MYDRLSSLIANEQDEKILEMDMMEEDDDEEEEEEEEEKEPEIPQGDDVEGMEDEDDSGDGE